MKKQSILRILAQPIHGIAMSFEVPSALKLAAACCFCGSEFTEYENQERNLQKSCFTHTWKSIYIECLLSLPPVRSLTELILQSGLIESTGSPLARKSSQQ